MRPIVTSLLACEQVDEMFRPVGVRKAFFPPQHGIVCVLAHFKWSKQCDVRMDWYIASELDQPLCQYLIQLPERNHDDRYAFTAIDLRILLEKKSFNIFQDWHVKLFIDNEYCKETKFSVKNSGYSGQQAAYSLGTTSRIDIGV